MKNWTIKKRIILGFTAILVLVSGLAVTSFVLLRQIKSDATFVKDDALPGLSGMAEIKSQVGEIQIQLLRYLIAKNSDERKVIEDGIAGKRADIMKIMDDYKKSITLPEEQELYGKLEQTRDAYVAARAKMFELGRAEKLDEVMAHAIANVRPAYNAYQEAVNKLLAFNIDLATKASERTQGTAQHAGFINVSVSIAVVALGIVIGFLLVTGLNRALNTLSTTLAEGSSQVAAAAGELSGASQSLAEGSSEQAASLEETSASLEEVSSMTKRNAQNAVGAKEFTARTRKTTEASAASTREMGAAMEGIKAASNEMRDAMNGIKAASGDVSKIIKTIDEIAFQTNILALNAAVEAARAGEAGMGFAVVADEVRNLAQRSAKAARETTDMIETSIKRSEDGVRVTEKVTTAVIDVATKSKQLEEHLTEILTNVQQVDEQVAQIASASQEQSSGISQVSVAVSQMDKVTQSTAANAEETASAAEELNAQSEVLRDAVNQLQKLITGHSSDESRVTHQASRPVRTVSAAGRTVIRAKPSPKGDSHKADIIPMPTGSEGKASVNAPGEMDFRNF